MPPSALNAISGFSVNADWVSEYNKFEFVIGKALSKMQTSTLVRVVACTNSGGVSPVGFVDVVPMVHQVDAQGVPTVHTTIFNVPYMRMQGGANAIIIDPQVGDIGIACFASRDLSKVKNTKQPNPPGSLRGYSFSDALYVGGMLNGTPTQFVRFSASGIEITSPTAVTINAPTATVNAPTVNVNATDVTVTATQTTINAPQNNIVGNTNITGNLGVTGFINGNGVSMSAGTITADVDVIGNGVSLKNHVHGGVQSGGSNTTPPT